MIRIRGPVGTLRVLLLPGECDPSWDDAESASGGHAGNPVQGSGPAAEARRDQ